MNLLCVDHLTIAECSPPELIAIAGGVGVSLVSLFVKAAPGMPTEVQGAELIRATKLALEEWGIGVFNVECFDLAPDARVADWRASLEIGARLGARAALAINYQDADQSRVLDNFSRLCELAAGFELNVNLEFISMGKVRTLDDALRLVTRSGQSNARVLVDTLHFFRTGGTLAELREVDPMLIGYVQISDGPVQSTLSLLEEACEERQLPGAAEFPLRDFVRTIPAGVPIGVEVPCASRRALGVSARAHVAKCIDSTRRLLSTP
jgi:sugar phosphate isomerase/epimerase